MTGLKNDTDLYEKIDYSLIPLGLIEEYIEQTLCGSDAPRGPIRTGKEFQFFEIIHDILNNKAPAGACHVLLLNLIESYGLKPLAVALGVGVAKYERGNWVKFDSDPDRFLRAAMRHLMAIITGHTYDGEEGIEGYPKGNDHYGAVCFNVMVADNIMEV